ncbi:MAG: hypothetical protein KME64_44230 [Scytonematopsis contorta HA4267-MV1]|nr:hypothetical protein [Scytonematopsis contorta HA4267-MV1]
MKNTFIYYFVIFLSSVFFSILIISHIFRPLHDYSCHAQNFMASSEEKFKVNATKVVVKPWLGEHHVYGIFMIPDEYKTTPFFVLTVKGLGSYCEKPFGSQQSYGDITALPGTHLIKDYIRTRLAIKLIAKGLYNQINNRENWSLTFPIIDHSQGSQRLPRKIGTDKW